LLSISAHSLDDKNNEMPAKWLLLMGAMLAPSLRVWSKAKRRYIAFALPGSMQG